MDVDESLHDAYHNKVEQLVGCNLGHEEKNLIVDAQSLYDLLPGDIDDDTGDFPAYYSQYEPMTFLWERSAAEGDAIVKKQMHAYVYTMKKEYIPKDALDLRTFCEKFLERAVVRFASEALRWVDNWGQFEVLLTDAEHEILSGMEEVASAVMVYMYLD